MACLSCHLPMSELSASLFLSGHLSVSELATLPSLFISGIIIFGSFALSVFDVPMLTLSILSTSVSSVPVLRLSTLSLSISGVLLPRSSARSISSVPMPALSTPSSIFVPIISVLMLSNPFISVSIVPIPLLSLSRLFSPFLI